MYKLLKKDGRAKRAEVTTVHGTIQTPVFMNVGTAAAIKGAVSTDDLQQIKTQVELSNTYHLHVRPGMGQADPDRFRWFPGFFSGRITENQRRGCAVSFSCRRT